MPDRRDAPAAANLRDQIQEVALAHVCLLAEECAHPRFGHVLPLGTLNVTINAGYE